MTVFDYPEFLYCPVCSKMICDDYAEEIYLNICEYYAVTGKCMLFDNVFMVENSDEMRFLEKIGSILTSDTSESSISAKPVGYEKISDYIHKFCFKKH